MQPPGDPPVVAFFVRVPVPGQVKTRLAGVLVPVLDGGYCLIGLHATTAYRQRFAGIPWSTDQVLEKTLERCARVNQRVILLPALQDIDTIEDLEAYRRKPCASARATTRARSSDSGPGGAKDLEDYQRSRCTQAGL